MAEQRNSHISIREERGIKIVEFADRKILEELSITEIGDELAVMIAGNKGIKLLVSFKDVEHLSSAALGMLIKLNMQVSEADGQLKLSNITPQIYEVFKITRLNKHFDIYDKAEGALAAF